MSGEKKLKKVTLRVFEDDYQQLCEDYNKLGPNKAIRKILQNHCRRVREATSQTLSSQGVSYEFIPNEPAPDEPD